MKDKDIRQLIDMCDAPDEKSESAVSAEEIRSLVMAKVRRKKKEGFADTENIDYVEPRFVSVNIKEKTRFGIKTVAATAVCVGIVGILAYFAREDIGSEQFAANNGEEIPITDMSVSDTLTESDSDSAAETHPEAAEKFELLNGVTVNLVSDDNIITDYSVLHTLFAMEEDRVFFIGNGEHTDITDDISGDNVFIYSYTHPERHKLHYIAAAGVPANFGYIEVYPISFVDSDGSETRWAVFSVGLGCVNNGYLTTNVANKLREAYGIDSPVYESCNNKLMDLTDFSGKGGKVYSANLIDGAVIKLLNNGITEVITREPVEILEIQDGCLWVKNKGWDDINVTEEAQSKEYYIADLKLDNIKHVFIVRNTTDPDECGYIDIFTIDDETIGMQAIGRNIDNPYFQLASQAKKYKNWVYDAFKELELEISDYSGEGTASAYDPAAVRLQGFKLPYRVPVSDSSGYMYFNF